MERLVTRIGNEPAVPTEFDMDFAFDLDKETFDKLQRIFNRLCDLTDILGDDYDLDRLKELVQADREGKCVLLPCKDWLEIVFGEQEVFYGIDMECIEHPIREISVDSSSRCTWYDGWKSVVIKGYDENGLDWEFSPEEIGETVFLTREEAEAALEKMKGGINNEVG